MICGMDFDCPINNPMFYDVWVARDLDGNLFEKGKPYVINSFY